MCVLVVILAIKVNCTSSKTLKLYWHYAVLLVKHLCLVTQKICAEPLKIYFKNADDALQLLCQFQAVNTKGDGFRLDNGIRSESIYQKFIFLRNSFAHIFRLLKHLNIQSPFMFLYTDPYGLCCFSLPSFCTLRLWHVLL